MRDTALVDRVPLHVRFRATTTATVLSELDQKLMEAATYNATVQAENEEHERAYQANLKEVQDRHKDGKGGRRMTHPQNSVDGMDVDESPYDGPKLRNRKYVLFFCFLCIVLLVSTDQRQTLLRNSPKGSVIEHESL